MKIRRLIAGDSLVRCMAWYACSREECKHHRVHIASRRCAYKIVDQVKWCMKVKGFVTDIPLDEIDRKVSSDPNLAFRMRKDVKNEKSD